MFASDSPSGKQLIVVSVIFPLTHLPMHTPLNNSWDIVQSMLINLDNHQIHKYRVSLKMYTYLG